MQKLSLDLDSLAVESFEPLAATPTQADKSFSLISCVICDWLSEMVC